MKIIVGCLLFIWIVSVGIFVSGNNIAPIEVVRDYFEFSRNQNAEKASELWSHIKPAKSDEPAIKNALGKFQFDVSYSKEIFEYKYKILDFREFPKSEDSTVLCLSIQNENKRKLVFRVELSLVNGEWKINNMKDAREDVLAVIHQDCSTVDF